VIVGPPPLLNFIHLFYSSIILCLTFSTMLLTGPFESQAVLGLPFFSPFAVALRRGTPEPHPLAFRVGPPAGPVTGRARAWAGP
jgi:hypothetical protein